jgi:hypothetical protein
MANEMVQGLLQNLLQPTQGPNPADIMAAISSRNPMASVAAMQAPQLSQMFGQQFRGLMGAVRGQPAPLTGNEAYAAAIQQLSQQPGFMANSESLLGLAKAASAVGRMPEAMQFSMLASQAQQQEAERNKQATQQTQSRTGLLNLVQGSSIPERQKIALGSAVMAGNFDGKADKLLEFTFPNKEAGDRYRTVGNYVWDNTTGSWAPGAGPTDVASTTAAATAPTITELPGIDFDQYDPSSFSAADSAFAKAKTPEEKTAALALLKPKLDAGEQWRIINGVEVPFPVSGAPRREAESAVSAYNQSKQNVLRKSDNVIGAVDRVLTSIADGKTDTGVGAALGFVPGTTWWNQRMNVETIRANLGFGELQSLRAAAANGASGLGQLTERELSRLEALSGNLSLASTKEQFVSVLNEIREFYASVKNQYTSMPNMTIEQYAGAPAPTQQTVTTPSGAKYTVEEIK